jgi:hypothetical protein
MEHGLKKSELVESVDSHGFRRRVYGTEESLGYLERILAGEPPALVACSCSSISVMNYAIVAALAKVTRGLAEEGKRLDLVIVEKGVDNGRQ